jgi:RNA polymerase sigma-70 factor (family 1)
MPDHKEQNLNCNIKELQHQVAVYEDELAYKQLFLCLFPSLQNFAFSILKSRQAAEETASDVLMEVWSRRRKLMEVDNLKLYLFTSTKHAAVRRLKQEKKIARFALDELQVEFVSDYSNPEDSCSFNELEKTIQRAVNELPPRCKMVYKLAKEDKMKYAEIADLLEISIKTIDNQLSIALKKIAVAIHALSRKQG